MNQNQEAIRILPISVASDSEETTARVPQPEGNPEECSIELEFDLGRQPDLKSVLAAWNEATVRLQQTHEALRAEVRRLTDELEVKNRELARKNRLADLGQMASHIAHEVRNNLVPMKLYLGLLQRRLAGDAGNVDVLSKIDAGFTSMESTVTDLLSFTSERDPNPGTFFLLSVINDICAGLAPQLEAQNIIARIDVPANLTMYVDRDMLRRALLNLVLNAIDAMPQGGELYLASYSGPTGVEIEVADSGAGLSRENCRKVFEPFYTTKSNGTGLGLAIVHRIVEVHGGGVTAMDCPDGGAAFTLRFPHQSWENAA